MAKRLVIRMTLEDEENWRNQMTIQHAIGWNETFQLGYPENIIKTIAADMFDRIKRATDE